MKAANVNMFREKQLSITGLLLFVLMSAVSANGTIDRIAISGSNVELPCSLPASHEDVTWEVENILGGSPTRVALCHGNSFHCGDSDGYKATRSHNSSTLFILLGTHDQRHYSCWLGNIIQQTFSVTFIDNNVISPPNCSINPNTSHQGRDATLKFSCEFYVPPELSYLLTMYGFSENISTSGRSDMSIEKDVDVENFREDLNVVCELTISNLNISEKCSFPHSTNVTYTPDVTSMVTDAVFDCHADPGDTVTWRLLDSEGREDDMAVRSWFSNEGTSLLIKNISEQDLGKVAECRISGYVGFGVIDEIGSSESDGYNVSIGTYGSHGDRLVYVVLTFVFGGLLLLTILIIISHWRCGACAHPMKWYAQFKPHGKPKTLTTNHLSDSTGPNVSGGGSNSRSPVRDVLTTESNLNSGNQNNSALNHPRDPTPQMKATSSSNAGASSSVHPDQPVVDTNKHTYFCVERSTPPPSLPDLSTTGSVTIYQDPDYEESHGERLRDSAGYDVVDASKKKMNNNFDMDDYAEVGGAYGMTSNPAIAPHSSKGLTGKGVVMSSDPAVLYGKVNK